MKESLIAMAIFYGLVIVLLLCFVGGFVLPALCFASEEGSEILVSIAIGSWSILFFLAIIGCDRICGYFTAPKGHRGHFWFVKEARRIKTFDLSEIEREAQRARKEDHKP